MHATCMNDAPYAGCVSTDSHVAIAGGSDRWNSSQYPCGKRKPTSSPTRFPTVSSRLRTCAIEVKAWGGASAGTKQQIRFSWDQTAGPPQLGPDRRHNHVGLEWVRP
jgi:hypothetical protein